MDKADIVERLKALQEHLKAHECIVVNGTILKSSVVRKALTEIKLNGLMNEELSVSESLLLQILIAKF